MSDIKLNLSTMELDLTSGGAELVDGLDAIQQHFKLRFQMILGEWFRDPNVGVPYYEDVFPKGADLAVIRALFREVALDTPGIDSIKDLVLTFDGATRILTVRLEAISEDQGPFIYDEPLVL